MTSKDCWMKDRCWKYINVESCECRNNDVFCIKLYKMNALYEKSLLSDKQRKYVPLRIESTGTDRDAFLKLHNIEENIETFVNNGDNLYIYSNQVGNGKTSWAIRLLQAYLQKIYARCDLDCKVLFVSVPTYLLEMKNALTERNEYAEYVSQNVLKADIVVFDDIATKTATTFEHEKLFSIIDQRLNYGKSCIFTSNVDYNGLTSAMGSRIASRIFRTSDAIEFHGCDKRCLGEMS